jgi:ABC-type molybdate transport system substrate-binding protein
MKRFIVPLLTAAIVVSMVLTGCVPGAAPPVTPPPVTPPPVTPPPVTPPPVTPPPVAPAGKFGLDDIPPIQNKTPLNIVIESGAFTDVQRPFIEEFTEATGIPVTIHPVGSTEIYSKQIPELKAGTGAYDIIMNETAWTWGTAQYAWKIKDLANQFDPGGWEARYVTCLFR